MKKEKVKKVKKPLKKEKTLTSEVKKEKWYINLKKKMLEDQKEMSKKNLRDRNFIALAALICFLAVFLATCFLDYSRAYKSSVAPLFVIRHKDDYKQAEVYYGIFYKAWTCNNGEKSIQFGVYSSEINNCSIVVSYDKDGYYENPNGIKMSKKEINTIKTYFYDYFNEFKTEKELENAYKISKAINEVWWVKNVEPITLDDGSTANMAIFNKFVNNNGEYLWELQYDNEEFHKCVKNQNNEYVFSEYDQESQKCGTEWKHLNLSKSICSLTKTSIKYVKELVSITKLCE